MRRVAQALQKSAFRWGLALVSVVSLSACTAPPESTWSFWRQGDETSEARVDHDAWNQFLEEYVVDDGSGINKVRYGAVTPESRRSLENYLKRVSALDPRALSRREQFVYWMNLYNALTVDVVLRHPDDDSIMDMGEGVAGTGPWRDKLLEIAGQRVSLDDIEHRILRPLWRDHRIHYGVNCASLSCPSLFPLAFTADNVDALLDRAERDYVNSERGVSFDDRGQLTLSSIYDWYAGDFAPSERALLEYLSEIHESERERLLSYDGTVRYDYDWSLNAQ